jgi:hypothetical protein
MVEMKPFAAWLEPLALAVGLLFAMIVMMWLQRPGVECALPFELPRRLVLSRDIDREHLAADLASADRIARRYMRATVDPAQHTRFLDCRATLVEQLATRHGVDEAQVRAPNSATIAE